MHKVYVVNFTTWYLTAEFDPLDVKKVSESQKCAQSVLNRNERHTTWWLEQLIWRSFLFKTLWEHFKPIKGIKKFFFFFNNFEDQMETLLQRD